MVTGDVILRMRFLRPKDLTQERRRPRAEGGSSFSVDTLINFSVFSVTSVDYYYQREE